MNAHDVTPAIHGSTPMMRQYLSVKAEYPGTIVFFRMGDFFETFFEDAEICSRLLDITLTARSKEKDPVPMAGVPHHAVEGYIARLVDFGRTVVLVDQVEDPRFAKGLVKREVTRVITPGTFLDEGASPRVPNYLSAIAFEGRRTRSGAPVSSNARNAPATATRITAGTGRAWGLSALDLSTGEFRSTFGRGDDLLVDELARLGAREILLCDEEQEASETARIRAEFPKATLTLLPPATFDPKRTRDVLVRLWGQFDVHGLGTALPTEALTAAGAAISYVEHTQMQEHNLRHIEPPRPYLPGEGLTLDAQAWTHLELFRATGDTGKRGTLFGAIDEAVTAMGGRLLGRWLAYPLRDLAEIRARQDAIEALTLAPSILDRLRGCMTRVADLERLVGRIVMGRASPRDLGALRASLGMVPELLSLAGEAAFVRGSGREEGHLREISGRDACADVARALSDALVDDPPSDLSSGDAIFKEGFDGELDRAAKTSSDGKVMIAEMEAKERARSGIASLKVRYNRVFGYYIEITRANLERVPADYVRKQTTAGGERYSTEALRRLETQVLTAEELREERARVLFTDLVARIADEAKRLTFIAQTVARLDVLLSLAKVAEERAWVRPVVDDRDLVEIAEGRHPVLELLSSELGERFVPNDVVISDEQRLVIITGPNMAGKSTIMRQTALLVILAQMGSFVPARAARVGLVDRIFTRVGASDELSRGRSTFMVEMSETARILRSATSRSLILLDEIGRGTSTFDGLSIAWSVAEYLHDVVRARTFFATHYHELTEICRDKACSVNRHVAVKECDDRIVFLRQLRPGPTDRSYGVQVAQIAGLPGVVIDRARAVLADLEAKALYEERSAVREVVSMILATTLDDMTPRQALDQLAKLKEILMGPPRDLEETPMMF